MKKFLSYQKASALCIKHKIINHRHYRQVYKSISNRLPSNPSAAYKDKGWCGYGEFLGTGATLGKNFLSYEDASALCIKHKVLGQTNYHNHYKDVDQRLPRSPDVVYKDKGWNCWGVFLGTGRKYGKANNVLSYKDAQQVCKDAKVLNSPDYQKRYKDIHPNLPSSPYNFYKDSGWSGWKAFLDTALLSYEQAKSICLDNNVIKPQDYRNRYKTIHRNLPSYPNVSYKDNGWVGWASFLGKDSKIYKRKSFLSFEKAKSLCRIFKIDSKSEYVRRCKEISSELPSCPYQVYEDDWDGWFNFLGRGKRSKTRSNSFFSYAEAKAFCIENRVSNKPQYLVLYNEVDSKLPRHLHLFYKEFVSWADFLNIEKMVRGCPKKTYMSYLDARALCIQHNVSSQIDYRTRRKQIDETMASDPQAAYKDSGWISWYHFFGTKS